MRTTWPDSSSSFGHRWECIHAHIIISFVKLAAQLHRNAHCLTLCLCSKACNSQGGFVTLHANSHCLQLCSTIPVWSVRFCYLASAILLHPEYSHNYNSVCDMMYIAPVPIVYSHIAFTSMCNIAYVTFVTINDG